MGVSALGKTGARAVFLDRDGVLNQAILRDGKPGTPSNLDEFRIVPAASQCLQRLKQIGLVLIVVTNQPDVGRGRQSISAVEEMHRLLRTTLPLDDILACFHDAAQDCLCRKPRTGLLLQAREKHDLDLSQSFFIGDRWMDIDAGNAAGCKTVLIECGYQERGPSSEPSARVSSLGSAVNWIIEQTAAGRAGHANSF